MKYSRTKIVAVSAGISLLIGIFLILTTSAHADGVLDTVVAKFREGLENTGLSDQLVEYAKRLFAILAMIQLAWNFGQLFMEGRFEAQAIVAMSVRQIMHLGFFYWILTHGAEYFGLIIDSFAETGARLSGVSNLYGIFDIGIDTTKALLDYAWKVTAWNDIIAVMLVVGICAIIILMAFATITFNVIGTLCETYAAINIGVYFLGFGACSQTKDIAINALKATYASGVRIFVLYLLVGIGAHVFPAFLQTIESANDASPYTLAFQLVIATFVFSGCACTLPGYISGIVTGAVSGSTSNLAGAIKGAAAAAAGAAVAAASMGVGAALGAAGAAGGIGAKAAGAAKGAMGGATGGLGSIAKESGVNAIKSGMSSGSNPNNVSPQ